MGGVPAPIGGGLIWGVAPPHSSPPQGSKTRKIPYPTRNPFTWLFLLVSCPNYTYEVGGVHKFGGGGTLNMGAPEFGGEMWLWGEGGVVVLGESSNVGAVLSVGGL